MTQAGKYEEIELAVYQSTNVNELETAYQMFRTSDRSMKLSMISAAGPARVLSFALRGYELPDAETRAASSQFVVELSALLDSASVSHQPLKEQLWLMLAQQQEILLSSIEADLEALYRSARESEQMQKQRAMLGNLHVMIRRKSQKAVTQLFDGVLASV